LFVHNKKSSFLFFFATGVITTCPLCLTLIIFLSLSFLVVFVTVVSFPQPFFRTLLPFSFCRDFPTFLQCCRETFPLFPFLSTCKAMGSLVILPQNHRCASVARNKPFFFFAICPHNAFGFLNVIPHFFFPFFPFCPPFFGWSNPLFTPPRLFLGNVSPGKKIDLIFFSQICNAPH